MSVSRKPSGTLFTTSTIKKNVYDVICIGSGWAARPIGERIVAAGYTAVLLDDELMGGDCPYWACVPSKCLLRPAEALDAAQAVEGARERVSNPDVDVSAVFHRRDDFTRGWDDEKLLVPAILATGADALRGKGKLTGEKKVTVTGKDGSAVELTATHAVVVCTGSVPALPDIEGLKDANPWTPREATSSSTVPDHLVVMGAGAVGTEMATAYASYGAKVTMVVSTAEILPRIDHEAGAIVRKAMEERGIRFLLQNKVSRVERKADRSLIVTTTNGKSFGASEILVAAGRRARTNDCGLELFGIPTNGTPVKVDDSLRVEGVSGQWLYASGDVNGRAPLTHMCKYHGRIVANAIVERIKQGDSAKGGMAAPWSRTSATADHHAIPQVVFTRPAVAQVGLTRDAAERAGRKIRIIQAPSANVGVLLHGDEKHASEGWAQWIVDAESQKLLGMTVVGHDMTELIHAATVAIVGGLRLDQLAHAVPCFPTMSEVYLNLADAAGI